MARRALLVVNSLYDDPGLGALPGADADAEALSRVLADETIGGYTVKVVAGQDSHVVAREIERFFKSALPEDLLLLHLSCHGRKDLRGRLFFAARNTEIAAPDSTSVAAGFINDQAEQSRSQHIVVLLDCCYSGAFVKGMRTRSGDPQVDVAESFTGRGLFVITSSTSLQYSYESGELASGRAEPSVFTQAVVASLREGTADRDGDGRVGLQEFYDDVYDRVSRAGLGQTPTRSLHNAVSELFIARNPNGPVRNRAGSGATGPSTTPSGELRFDPVEGGGYVIREVRAHMSEVTALVGDPHRRSPARSPYFRMVTRKDQDGWDRQQVDAHIEQYRAEPASFLDALRMLLADEGVPLVAEGGAPTRRLAKRATRRLDHIKQKCLVFGDEQLIGYVRTGPLASTPGVIAFTDKHLCVQAAYNLLRVPYSRVEKVSLPTSSTLESWGAGDAVGTSHVITMTVTFEGRTAQIKETNRYPLQDTLHGTLSALVNLRKRHPDWFRSSGPAGRVNG